MRGRAQLAVILSIAAASDALQLLNNRRVVARPTADAAPRTRTASAHARESLPGDMDCEAARSAEILQAQEVELRAVCLPLRVSRTEVQRISLV